MLLNKLRDLLKLQEGEGRRLVPLLLMMFLTLTNLILLKSTASSLFLSRLGADQLSIAFLWVAFTAAFSTLIFSFLSRKFSLTTLIYFTQFITAVLAIWFMLLEHYTEPNKTHLFIFYVWSNLYGVITVSQVYLLAGEIFGIREAKRLFIWVGVAAISGGVFGGYLTSVLATFFNRAALLYTAAGLSFASIICSFFLRSFVNQPGRKKINSLGVAWQEFWYPFHYLRHSNYLHLIAGIVSLAVMVAKLVEYQYSSFAVAVYQDVEELAAFFGFWLSTISLLSLGIQLFFTKYALKNIGVARSLQILPMGLLMAMVVLLVFPLLWAVILARAIDGGFKQSLHKSAFELLLLPLPNAEKKFSKTFIDVFVDSLATGLSGLLLIFLIQGSNLPIQAVTILTLVLLVVWVWITYKLGEAYLDTFRLRLHNQDASTAPENLSLDKPKVLEGMAFVLEKGSINQMRYVLKKLINVTPHTIFEQPLIALLNHSHADIRAGAVTCLSNYKRINLDDRMLHLLEKDPAVSVKVEALFYLLQRYPRRQLKQLVNFLDNENFLLADVALLALISEVSGNPVLWEKLKMTKRLANMIDTVGLLPEGNQRDELQFLTVRAIAAARDPDFYHHLEEWLPNASSDVRKSIFNAMEQLQEARFLPHLWNQLHGDQALQATQVMSTYNEEVLLSFLDKRIQKEALSESHLVPRILANLPSPKVVAYLLDWLNSTDTRMRDEALNALCRIQEQRPRIRFDRKRLQLQLLKEANLFQRMLSLLQAQLRIFPQDENPLRAARRSLLELLEARLDRNIERIFLLLGLRYATSDFMTIYTNLRSTEPDRRNNALEFLENLLEPSLKGLILPVAELVVMELPFNEQLDVSKQLPEEAACYQEIFALNDHQLTLSLLHLIRTTGDAHYRYLVSPLLNATNPAVKMFAEQTMAAIGN
jgi:AAA family ATP:ADP antiporter